MIRLRLGWFRVSSGGRQFQTENMIVGVLMMAWSTSMLAAAYGTVWPLPQYMTTKPETYLIDPADFDFKITNDTCDIIIEAVRRYKDVVKQLANKACSCCGSQPLKLTQVDIELTSPCEMWPHLHMDEHYELHIGRSNVVRSSSVWGILRGLETLTQLIHPSCLTINSSSILDYPRFMHRGLLLDSSRHFLPVPVILTMLSAMEMNKMNVLHWHIVDDESFPYQSPTFPSLSKLGAYDPTTLIYSQENITNIIEFARLRGIRVIPEFDSPGHTRSWGKGAPKLLTACYSQGKFNGVFGPVDPSRKQNYKFMNALFQEVKNLFQDNYLHIGGDEVSFDCWRSNPMINQFMKQNNITSYEGLEDYYIRQVLKIVSNVGASGIVWQEVFLNNVTLPNDTLVHIWMGNRSDLLDKVTQKGHFALLSEGWYLDHLEDQWHDMYTVDPMEFPGSKVQQTLVLGGEACMWGEMVDETNIVPRVWPRASAVAERLWASKHTNQPNQAKTRLNDHVCYMRRRGVAAEPANGAGFCPY